uniref:VP n=1 Tax=uncultured densovirus TaxID=748192 RepID=A0A7L7YQM1_9VIRU|nr:VP [uncultured densovirus]
MVFKITPRTDVLQDKEFIKLPKGQQLHVVANWNRLRSNAGLPRVYPPLRYFGYNKSGVETNTHRPRIDEKPQGHISYRQAFPNSPLVDNGPLLQMWEKYNAGTANPMDDPQIRENLHLFNAMANDYDLNTPSTSAGKGPKRQKTGSNKRPAEEQITPGPRTTTTTSTIGPDVAGMASGTRSQHSISEDGSEMAAGSSASTASSSSGHNSSSDGGFDSAQGPLSLIQRPSFGYSAGSLYFKKVHHMKSYAVPHFNLVDTNSLFTTSPLAEIPWQYTFFYMSEPEFDLIPRGSNVDKVKISIQIVSASTGHPVGGAVSSLATFQHPKIGMLGYDLRNKIRSTSTRRLTLDANLIPTASASITDHDNFIDLQYGNAVQSDNMTWNTSKVPGVNFGIPFNTFDYLCHYSLSAAGANAGGFNIVNAPGFENWMNHITQFNVNDKMWDKVFEREYSFSSAPIGVPFRMLELAIGDFRQCIGDHSEYALYNRSTTNNKANSTTQSTKTEIYGDASYANVNVVTYKGLIEQGAHNRTGSGTHKPARQPSVHIGMKAIPKLAAEMGTNRAEEFVFADLYYVVTAEMFVTTNGYPNHFTRPPRYNVSIENAVTGVPNTVDPNSFVSFGLYDEVIAGGASSRPRSLPYTRPVTTIK